MNNNTNKTFRTMILILGIMVLFYFLVFFVWNKSSPNHKPSHLFLDTRKEGYKEDPLEDRKKVGD